MLFYIDSIEKYIMFFLFACFHFAVEHFKDLNFNSLWR